MIKIGTIGKRVDMFGLEFYLVSVFKDTGKGNLDLQCTLSFGNIYGVSNS